MIDMVSETTDTAQDETALSHPVARRALRANPSDVAEAVLRREAFAELRASAVRLGAV